MHENLKEVEGKIRKVLENRKYIEMERGKERKRKGQ